MVESKNHNKIAIFMMNMDAMCLQYIKGRGNHSDGSKRSIRILKFVLAWGVVEQKKAVMP
jgi:hypothetical protein